MIISKSIENLLTIFVGPLLQLCIVNIINYSSIESIHILNTILNLEEKKDFSKDAWVIHEVG